MERKADAVVFDLGNVLIPWNPRNLYRKLFPDDEPGMERFLSSVCTVPWNETFDLGRPFSDGVAELVARHPAQADLIRAYDTRWEEMLGETIEENVRLMKELKAAGIPLYALSNWPMEKLPAVRRRPFYALFDGAIISSEVGIKKPSPGIFELLIARFKLIPERTVFIDDSQANVEAARKLGIIDILYRDPASLRMELSELMIP
jgi:2-haloacid dehalogenase